MANNLSPTGREPVSPLSPENFHVSLSSLFTGGDPLIPAMLVSPLSDHAIPATSDEAADLSSEGTKEGQSSEVSTSEPPSGAEESGDSEDSSKMPCKEQRNSNDGQSIDHTESTETSEAETSSKCSSEPRQHEKKKKNKAEPKSTQSSEATSDDDISKSNHASTSANTNEGDSSAPEPTDNDDSEWTMSDDAKLRGMKEDDRGPTWVEISKVLGRPKKDCQMRWGRLKNQPKPSDADDEHDKRDDDKQEKKQKDGGKGGRKQAQNKQGGKQKQQGGKQKQKGHKHQKPKPPTPSPSIYSGDVPSSSTSSTDSSLSDMTFAGPSKTRRQKRYMHNHVHSSLYSRTISPEPDEYFSQRDCDVLANIDSKYKQGKYLEMQANFYNVTGRMIPLGFIRDKCERAEEQERGRGREEGRRGRVERWVSSVEEDDLEDPES